MGLSIIPADAEYDVIVIGSGPAGEGAAMKAAKDGKSVAIIERYHKVGGGCTHWATIPSKSLRHSVGQVLAFRRSGLFSEVLDRRRFTFPMLLEHASSVIRRQVNMRRDFYLRNHVTVIHGQGRFVDPHTIEIEGKHDVRRMVRGRHVIIATGTRPYRPKNIDFEHPRVFDSDTILKLAENIDTISIYGAGVVGCEYASIFRNLGVKVNLINSRDKLLSFLDDEIIDALSYHLREQGVVIRHNEEYESVETRQDSVVVNLKSGKRIKSDILLWAQGRTGNTDDLGLEHVGIEPNSRGQLDVDENYRCLHEHIYAVGDVTGYPSLASASYDQGRFAASRLSDTTASHRLVEDIPTGIYTTPEISSVGRNERELTAENVPYEVGHALFRSLARAQITGNTVGMLKILFHRDTLQLLGIHCFGDQAAEIVHIGQAIMAQEGEANTVEYFVNTTFNYPTMAEAYRVAALNGLNRLC